MNKHTLVCVVFAVVLCGPPDRSAFAQDVAKKVDYSAMSKDIEIMRRVLTEVLRRDMRRGANAAGTAGGVRTEDGGGNETGAPEEPEESEDLDVRDAALLYHGLVASASGRGSFPFTYSPNLNIDGYYIRNTGVIFSLDLPIGAKQVEPSRGGANSKEDLWAQAKDEVDGSRSRNLFSRRSGRQKKRMKIDQADLDRVVGLLVRTVADYGWRIGQLRGDDRVILIGRVETRAAPETVSAVVGPGPVWGYSPSHSTPGRVIIQVPVSAIHEYHAGSLDLAGVQKRVQVTSYRAHKSRADSSVVWTNTPRAEAR